MNQKWKYYVCKSWNGIFKVRQNAADVAPINSEQNININPNFTLECKWLFAGRNGFSFAHPIGVGLIESAINLTRMCLFDKPEFLLL